MPTAHPGRGDSDPYPALTVLYYVCDLIVPYRKKHKLTTSRLDRATLSMGSGEARLKDLLIEPTFWTFDQLAPNPGVCLRARGLDSRYSFPHIINYTPARFTIQVSLSQLGF